MNTERTNKVVDLAAFRKGRMHEVRLRLNGTVGTFIEEWGFEPMVQLRSTGAWCSLSALSPFLADLIVEALEAALDQRPETCAAVRLCYDDRACGVLYVILQPQILVSMGYDHRAVPEVLHLDIDDYCFCIYYEIGSPEHGSAA